MMLNIKNVMPCILFSVIDKLQPVRRLRESSIFILNIPPCLFYWTVLKKSFDSRWKYCKIPSVYPLYISTPWIYTPRIYNPINIQNISPLPGTSKVEFFSAVVNIFLLLTIVDKSIIFYLAEILTWQYIWFSSSLSKVAGYFWPRRSW